MSADLRPEPTPRRGWQRPLVRWALEFALLFGLWLALSGNFDPVFLVFGAIFSVIVVAVTQDISLPSDPQRFVAMPESPRWLVATGVRFLLYLPWLLWQILLANVHVAYLVLHPRIPIDPKLVRFHTHLETEPAQVLLAHSITLTPGTITVDIDTDGRFLVHALTPTSSEGLAQGAMQNKVGRVFGQQAAEPPVLHIVTDSRELE